MGTQAEKQILLAVNAIDPKVYADNPAGFFGPDDPTGFPGLRGADQLIVYTESYGKPSTGTNSWGVEIAVDADGMLLSRGGGDTMIPAGGCVLSGVGTAVDTLQALSLRGTRVVLDRTHKQVVVTTSPALIAKSMALQLRDTQQVVDAAKAALLDIDYGTTDACMESAAAFLREMESMDDAVTLGALADKCESALWRARLAAMPCCRVEKRAVWYRVEETDEQQVRDTLTYVKKAGLTAVYIEAWIEGNTIWPSALPDVPMFPDLHGFDAMEAFVRIGHELGLEIHAWVETFFIGAVPCGVEDYDAHRRQYAPLTLTHADWLLHSRRGLDHSHINGDNLDMYYFNASLPQAQDFVLAIYDELLQKYPVDGISFDYVRFPVPNEPADGGLDDFGYNDDLLAAFAADSGCDARTLTPSDARWTDWCHFRAGFINRFVCRASERVRMLRPDLSVSVSVFGDFDVGPLIKYQEPMDWVHRGAIDEVFLMSYYMDERPVIEETREALRRADDMAYVSTGLAVYMNTDQLMLCRQVLAVREQQAASVAFFALAQYRQRGYETLLRQSVFRDDSIASPDRVEQAVPAMFREMLRRIHEIYLPRTDDGELDYPLTSLRKTLEETTTLSYDSDDTAALLRAIADIRRQIEPSGICPAAKKALLTDLSRTAYFLHVHQKWLAQQGHRA